MLGAFLSLSRPLAMQALSNPTILGSLLVGAVGSQQASEIQNQLNLGNISLDNVYDTIINFAASPAVSALRDTPSGTFSAPELEEIEKEQERMRELNKQITLPSEIPIGQILSTPQTTTVPEPLITPDVPEEKVSVDDVGMTSAPAPRLEDMIMTLDKLNKELSNIKVSDQIANLEDDQYGNIGTRGFTEEVAQEIYQAKGYDDYQKKIQEIVRDNLGDTFTVYRGTTTEEFDLEQGEPITRAGVSVTLNPQEAENFVSGKLSLPKKTGDPVLLKITATPEMIVMRGADSGELVLDGYSLNKSNMEIIPISGITSTNEKTDTVRQGEGQTAIEALKTKSLQGENVDQGSSGSSRENVLKTEEGFEVANKALGIDFFTKVLTKEIAPPKKKYEPILDVSDIGNTFDVFQEKRTGDFENHIFTSIPTFQEAQVATADALIKTLPQNGSILDLGGTEGGFINTITEERPDVSGFIVDPNVVAQKMFNEQQMPNAYYIREAFTTDSSQFGKYAFDVEDENETPIETSYFDFNIVDDNSLDAVTEKMTFQFIDKGRNNKIKLISEKLKPEGIALFEEKFFTSKEDPVWQANEAKKNEFKLNYYDQKDLTEKQKNILEGMDKHQVTSPEFEEILSKYFNNVVQYWDSGNFKGYVASDSADTITKFLNNLEDLNSEYSNVSTPKFVTDKIVEKRRGGSISLPQMNML
jgi:uncharacterized protein YutD